MKPATDLDHVAKQVLVHAMMNAIKEGGAISPDSLAGIREEHEAKLAEATPGSKEALIAQRVLDFTDYVREGRPLPGPTGRTGPSRCR